MSDVRLVATNPDNGTLVPVASNASGQLAVQSPSIEKIPNDFDVEGDLTVYGGASFSRSVIAGEWNGTPGSGTGVKIGWPGIVTISRELANESPVFECFSGIDSIFEVKANGDVNITGRIDAEEVSVYKKTSEPTANVLRVFTDVGATPDLKFFVKADGSSGFSGDVIVGSRNKKWKLVEQGGLCHMVEQIPPSTADLVDPAVDPAFSAPASDYPKLRDVFAELDVVEKALEQVMEKLRMVEPDGWPVWDGSSNS